MRDEWDYFARAAALVADDDAVVVVVVVARIKYPKKCPMNLRKIAVPERTAVGIDLVFVVVMKMMIKDQMKKLNSKNSVRNEI